MENRLSLMEFKSKKDDDILRSMIDYMNFEDEDEEDEAFDCGYSQQDIDACAGILDSYIDALIECNGDDALVMDCVKKVILQLNDLNVKCSYSLIETDQREALCPFIEEAAVLAGLPQPTEDITEEWREW